MLWKNSLFVLVSFILSNKNSIASVVPIGAKIFLRINIFPSDFIFSRTQNPVVYKIFSRFFKLYGLKIAPSLNGFDSKCIKVARSLGFDVDDNLIIKNAVRGIVAKNTPFIEGEIDTLWKKIDLNNGDVYLVVGYK